MNNRPIYQCDTGLLSKTGGRPQVSWCRINHRFCSTAAISISQHILFTWCCVGITAGYLSVYTSSTPGAGSALQVKQPCYIDRPQVSWCRVNHRFCSTAAISICLHILYTWCWVGIAGYTTLLH
ncbi:hypothetical protein J6590_050734 [Homalodisca vitripennis]|nr:hypothetical protein J6590_050734 [Homalodisca vitripennis]